ncbi:hypothetical protein Tco_0044050 [Tanacetum coccineum]
MTWHATGKCTEPGNESSELFALACGSSQTPISVNSCVVNGVRFVVHNRDECHTTQNNGICSPGPDEEMYYAQLEQILEFRCVHAFIIVHEFLYVILMLLVQMSADVARGHGGDGKGTRKPNLGGRRAGRQHTCQETRNLGLKAITDKSGLVPIRFEFGDRETLMPLGEHAAHWANYLGELVRELPLHYPSWRQVPAE